MGINKISGNILADNLIRGTDLAFQTDLIYIDILNSRVGINTASTSETLTVEGNVAVGNMVFANTSIVTNAGDLILQPSANIDASNTWIANLQDPVQNQDAATKKYVDDEIGTGFGNLVVSNTTISTSISPGNITLQPTGGSTVIIDTNSGLVIPVGNIAQRPSLPSTGTVRFNTDLGRVEIYDGTSWEDVVANVTNQVLNGDGITTVFTLDRGTTSAAALVMINGVVQLPVTAYSVTGNQITFTQPPVISDIIDIRFL